MSSPGDVARRFVEAVSTADGEALAACFSADVRLRALIPPGLRQVTGADAAASLITSWFADCDPLRLVGLLCSGFRPRAIAR